MLYLLVACAAAQLGGEETDGYIGDPLPDTGSAVDSLPTGMSSPSTSAGGDSAPSGGLEVFGMVGGVAVTDHGVTAADCTALDFGDATTEEDTAGRQIVVTYGLPDVGDAGDVCVVSWTYLGLAAGVWSLDVDGRTASFEVF